MDLKQVLSESNKSISSYELSISGLVQTLLLALSTTPNSTPGCHGDADDVENTDEHLRIAQRNKIFSRVFNLNASSGENVSSDLILILLHKLTALLESIEKLPLFLYDAPGSYNLQAFSKRFKLILNKGENEKNFLDFTGRTLKVEPLANISHLEKYIAKMVSYCGKIIEYKSFLPKNRIVDFKVYQVFAYWIDTIQKLKIENNSYI